MNLINQQRWGLIAGLLAALSFGLSAPLISLVSRSGSPLVIAALLYLGAGLALLLVCWLYLKAMGSAGFSAVIFHPYLG